MARAVLASWRAPPTHTPQAHSVTDALARRRSSCTPLHDGPYTTGSGGHLRHRCCRSQCVRSRGRVSSRRPPAPPAQIAAGFVRNGAHVYVSSRSKEACDKVAAALSAAGPGTCTSLPQDLATVAGCDALAAALRERTPRLHVLVNNSGTSWGEPFETHSAKGWDKVYDLNVKAIFFLTRAVAPLLDAASSPDDPARVINIGSIAGLRPQPFPTFSYDVSKAAVHHLTRKLADELADRRAKGGAAITVNAVAPGYVPSKMSQGLEGYASTENMLERIPLKARRDPPRPTRRSSGARGWTLTRTAAARARAQRMGRPADMAGVCLFLSSPAGAWITGIVVPVDGGYLAKL